MAALDGGPDSLRTEAFEPVFLDPRGTSIGAFIVCTQAARIVCAQGFGRSQRFTAVIVVTRQIRGNAPSPNGPLPVGRLQRSLPGWHGPRRPFVPRFHWQLSPTAPSVLALSPYACAFQHRSKSTAYKVPHKSIRFFILRAEN